MGWVADDDDDTQWWDLARFKQFFQAINERNVVYTGTIDTPLPAEDAIAHLAIGNASAPETSFPIAAIDEWIILNVGSFVAPFVPDGAGGYTGVSNFDGLPRFYLWGTEENLDDGFLNIYWYVNGKRVETVAEDLPSPAQYRYGFTRKYPKEFLTLATPAAFADGGGYITRPVPNSDETAGDFKDGDYARCMADAKVYHREAGAWVVTAEGERMPDVFDDVDYVIREGDIIGPWVWNERRKALSAMKWTGTRNIGGFVPEGVISEYLGEGGSFDDPTSIGIAEDEAEAAWAEGSGSGFAQAFVSATEGPPVFYTATISRFTNWHFRVAGEIFTGASEIGKHYDWYYGKANNGTDIFDAQGDPVVNDDNFHLVSTDSTSDDHDVSDAPFTTNTDPPSWPPDPSPGESLRKGYIITALAVIIRWDFEFV